MTLLRRNRKWRVSGISSNHIERPHVALSCKVTLSKAESELSARAAASEELRRQLVDREAEIVRLRDELAKGRTERDLVVREAAELKGKMTAIVSQNEALLKRVGKR